MENGIRKIAFPSLSTGAFAYPIDKAAEVAVSTVYDLVAEYPDQFDLIEWICYDKNTLRYYSQQIDQRT